MSGADKATDEQVIKELATDAPVKQLDNLGAAAKEATEHGRDDADRGDGDRAGDSTPAKASPPPKPS